MLRILPLLIALPALAACASEASIQQQFDDFVADNRSCEAPEDCAVIFPGCPLGCFEVVSASAVDDANALADRLIARYELGGRSCAYDCIETPPVACEAQTCVFIEE